MSGGYLFKIETADGDRIQVFVRGPNEGEARVELAEWAKGGFWLLGCRALDPIEMGDYRLVERAVTTALSATESAGRIELREVMTF